MGSFLFRWPHPEANDVHVTGTFDDWGKSVQLNKVGNVWEKDVQLSKAEKILYKFVVNDQWIIDPEAPQEDDGHGNVNNVLHPEQIKSKTSVVPEAFTTSSAAPGSTTAALAGGVPLEPKREATEVTPASDHHLNEPKVTTPGAFPETPANEKESYGVNPLPPTETAGNPINLPAGQPVPPLGNVTSNSTHSAVTTSQESYEKAGSGIPIIGGALAALGFGGAAAAAAASKKENLIPESSLPMGENADKSLGVTPFTSSAGANSTTSGLAGNVPLEEKKSATEVASAVPETVKESIAEAHASPEAATSTEAVKEKSAMEQELLKKVPENEATGDHAPTIAGGVAAAGAAVGTAVAGVAAAATATASSPASGTPATGVPEPVKESIAEAHAEPEATTSAEAVKEKSTVEQELLKKVPEQQGGGEPAPTIAAATSATAPGHSTTAAAGSESAADSTLLNEPAVQLGIQNDAEAAGTTTAPVAAAAATSTETPKATAPTTAAPESKKETTVSKPAATISATSTPQKPTTATASSTPASTASATKDKKKKNRVSSFFKKIFD